MKHCSGLSANGFSDEMVSSVIVEFFLQFILYSGWCAFEILLCGSPYPNKYAVV